MIPAAVAYAVLVMIAAAAGLCFVFAADGAELAELERRLERAERIAEGEIYD